MCENGQRGGGTAGLWNLLEAAEQRESGVRAFAARAILALELGALRSRDFCYASRCSMLTRVLSEGYT